MSIVPGKSRRFQRFGVTGMVAAACLVFGLVARASEREEAVKKLGFDPVEQPTVKWLPNSPLPNPAAEAKTEAEMKPYTEVLATEEIKFDMVPIKGGTFKMGSPANEEGRNEDEGPQVEVSVEPFWMGKCEVTWDEYETWCFELDKQRRKSKNAQASKYDELADAVARPTKPYTDMSFDMGKGSRPAICMTQYAAQMYCKWLSAKTGRYYRLPTEAEWEYACRAGTTTAYSFGNDPEKLKDYAWFGDNSNDKYQKVGTKKPNPWGLHDMHGNVCEWVLDQYIPDYYKTLSGKPVKNPYAVPTKEFPRTVRGGSWQDDPEALRSAARRGSHKDWKMQDPQIPQSIWYLTDAQFLGFRVIRPLRVPTPEEAKLYEPDPQIFKDYVAAQGGKQ
ncbi:MAG: formylglycine-generating enzyme family protein [Thermoguttaceae bacterium]|jgi:formylglycine-generating enzyme required for sulfatase activity|nr:formylglycine-generating enzyme family protein [Thermoguttaceae bacterium]